MLLVIPRSIRAVWSFGLGFFTPLLPVSGLV
jgi:hypothetical protein